ncbi:acetyl-CoA sensor PanZ family protein [Alcanivorax sp. 1008]|uniref:acetyl-CoA sensor PanZ family protein n=1 Tax=Alcanivorax sp. 1008 TaxID=2816853 RepID=UPI001D862119|nr:acetyl-CoA sensor PanZ family protein [Alcanivorax sp. 1008]MCC1495808.1 acetyl-CoA sensor PanZ family protein [Alcanivorax sp. 1008]
MPLIVSEIAITEASSADFANVLKADSELAKALASAAEQGEGRLFQGIFNARPVSLARVIAAGDGWKLSQIVVHPATRGRGVGKEMLRQTGNLLAPSPLDSGPTWRKPS